MTLLNTLPSSLAFQLSQRDIFYLILKESKYMSSPPGSPSRRSEDRKIDANNLVPETKQLKNFVNNASNYVQGNLKMTQLQLDTLKKMNDISNNVYTCLLYTSPSPRDQA
eukprot:TRINITY_DN2066_c0_g1_i7.p3 TRINITY_DN2066_c0_g1~~TRINITY_DN2066_c0_g1_i7.p3  ORF type:complete len:110 (-),score=18.82 TRINITY_DN2066_c0_g1_i7:36-365(-)